MARPRPVIPDEADKVPGKDYIKDGVRFTPGGAVREIMGRSTKYEPKQHIEMLLLGAQDGESISAFCSKAKISYVTFRQWKIKNKEFAQAVDLAKELRKTWWEKEGLKMMRGYYGKFQNASVYVWLTRNLIGFHDQQAERGVEDDENDFEFVED